MKSIIGLWKKILRELPQGYIMDSDLFNISMCNLILVLDTKCSCEYADDNNFFQQLNPFLRLPIEVTFLKCLETSYFISEMLIWLLFRPFYLDFWFALWLPFGSPSRCALHSLPKRTLFRYLVWGVIWKWELDILL